MNDYGSMLVIFAEMMDRIAEDMRDSEDAHAEDLDPRTHDKILREFKVQANRLRLAAYRANQ